MKAIAARKDAPNDFGEHAQTGPFQDKGGATWNARAYGLGDGSTTPNAAIEAALTAMKAAGEGGGTLVIPRGEYEITSALEWSGPPLRVVADGSRFYNNSDIGTLFRVADTDDVVIDGVRWEAGGGGHVARLAGCRRVIIHNCSRVGGGLVAVRPSDGVGEEASELVDIRNVEVDADGAEVNVVSVRGPAKFVSLRGFSIRNTAADGLKTSPGPIEYTRIEHGEFIDCLDGGVDLFGGGQHTLIDGVLAEGCATGFGVKTFGTTDSEVLPRRSIIRNCRVVDCVTGTSLAAARDVHVSHTEFEGCGVGASHAFVLDAGSGEVSFDKCRFLDSVSTQSLFRINPPVGETARVRFTNNEIRGLDAAVAVVWVVGDGTVYLWMDRNQILGGESETVPASIVRAQNMTTGRFWLRDNFAEDPFTQMLRADGGSGMHYRLENNELEDDEGFHTLSISGATVTQRRNSWNGPESGATGDRPSDDTHAENYVGQEYFDTTLGHAVWWDGSGWVDAEGTSA